MPIDQKQKKEIEKEMANLRKWNIKLWMLIGVLTLVLTSIQTPPVFETAYAADPSNGNIVANGDFADGINGWSSQGNATLTEDGGWGKVTVANPSSSNWDGAVDVYGGALKAGVEYTIAFDAKAEDVRGISLLVHDGTAWAFSTPWPAPLLSVAAKHYTFTFTPARDTSSVRVTMPIGDEGPAFWLDNLYIGPTASVPARSSNAALAELKIGGVALPGFDPGRYSYIYYGTAGDAPPPAVEAKAQDGDATVEVTQAAAYPGTATVKVTAADGKTTSTYAVQMNSPEHLLLLDSFDEQDIHAAPAGWTLRTPSSVAAEVYGSGEGNVYNRNMASNHTLRTYHTGWDANALTKTFEPQTGKLTFQFSFMDTKGGANTVFALTDSSTGQEALNLLQGWSLKYNVNGDDANTPVAIGTYTPMSWVTIRIVADIANHLFDIYVDGNKLASDVPFLNRVSQIDSVSVRHLSWASSDQQTNEEMKGAETYIDDMTVTKAPVVNDSIVNGAFSGTELAPWTAEGLEAANIGGHALITVPAQTGGTFAQSGIKLKAGLDYALSFQVRGLSSGSLTIKVVSDAAGSKHIVKAQTYDLSAVPAKLKIRFKPDSGTTGLDDSRILFEFDNRTDEKWRALIGNVSLLPADQPAPQLNQSASFTAIPASVNASEIKLAVVPSGGQRVQVSVDFANETAEVTPGLLTIEQWDDSGKLLKKVETDQNLSSGGTERLSAIFQEPDNSGAFRYKAYVASPDTKQPLSGIVELLREQD